jgi:hypothetical protein
MSIAGPRKQTPPQDRIPQLPPTPPQTRIISEGANPTKPDSHQTISIVPPQSNMFDMFNSEESNISITLSVKLPDKKLLKLMYQNAENKDKFLDELSDYMQRMINKQVIKDSVISIVDQSKTAKKVIKSGEITATEV